MHIETTAAPSLDEQGRLTQDVYCLKCDYNLRGLPLNGTCMECGTPVARSLHGRTLRASDPRWLERLAQGFLLLWIGAVLFAGLLLADWLSWNLWGSALLKKDDSIPPPISWAALQLLKAVAAAVMFIAAALGCWLVTLPEIGRLKPEPPINLRVIFRYSFLIAVTGTFVITALSPYRWLHPGYRLVGVGGSALAIVGGIALFSLLAYVRTLLRRIPDPTLASFSILGDVVLLITVAAGIALLYNLVPLMLHSYSTWLFRTVDGLINLTAWGGATLYVIMLLTLLPVYAWRLKQTADTARQTWAKAA
ncbi:MAG: hypothetical protein WD042_10845 [Phycisphaeraceae bacterium]